MLARVLARFTTATPAGAGKTRAGARLPPLHGDLRHSDVAATRSVRDGVTAIRARDGSAMNKAHSPAAVRRPFARYSHAVEVEAGSRMLFASGQLGISVND